MKLSSPQLEILRQLASCDEPLAYFTGSYWTMPSIGRRAGSRGFNGLWHTTLVTIRSLEERSLLEQTKTATNYDIVCYPNLADRVLTPKGLQEAKRHP